MLGQVTEYPNNQLCILLLTFGMSTLHWPSERVSMEPVHLVTSEDPVKDHSSDRENGRIVCLRPSRLTQIDSACNCLTIVANPNKSRKSRFGLGACYKGPVSLDERIVSVCWFHIVFPDSIGYNREAFIGIVMGILGSFQEIWGNHSWIWLPKIRHVHFSLFGICVRNLYRVYKNENQWLPDHGVNM